MEIKFKEVFKYEDFELREINFNFEKLKGNDVIDVIDLLQGEGKPVISPQLDPRVQINLAARACNIPAEVLQALPAGQFMKVCQGVQTFLLGSE